MLTTLTAQSVRPQVVYPLGVWLLMAVVAIGNGGFREIVLIPRIGASHGHVLNTALLVVAILVISGLYFSRTSVEYTSLELLVVGIVWTVLTIGFEFFVGYIEGTPVAVTVGQYNVFAGQVWIAVPLTLLCAPLLFGRYRS